MLRRRGVPYLEINSFKVSKFKSFKVLKFRKIKVSKFRSFIISDIKNLLKLPDKSITCFQNAWGTHSKTLNLSNSQISRNNMSGTCVGILFLDYFECPGVSTDKYYWFGESWSRPPGPRKIIMRGLRVI